MLQLFNTLSRKIETFRPIDPKKVKVYTCGPTVYSTPHIGNYTAYIYWDLLIRTLRANHFVPYRVLNLTDVGHLTSDGDEGEDKLEKKAKTSGQDVWEIAEFYIKEFITGFHDLKLIEPAVLARATDYIEQDIELVNRLTEKGYTYETSDGIYFDTTKFAHYGDFARLDIAGLKAGARVQLSHEKHNPTDFAVWKFIQPDERHVMRWEYLGRPGYPGWHLECSSIIHAELGEPIDIHTGGIDHIPVHHTNEIAQSEVAFGKTLAHYWLHCNHLTSEGKKLSKSLGNGYSLEDLKQKDYSPLDFKMWVLQGHYRSERDFSLADLESARIRRLNWRNRIARCKQEDTHCEMNFNEIISSINQDLNSAEAFAKIDSQRNLDLEFWKKVEEMFGLGLFDDKEPTNEQKSLLEKRKNARIEKNYTESDNIRSLLEKNGLTILDTATGQIWQYLR